MSDGKATMKRVDEGDNLVGRSEADCYKNPSQH